jgi:uncharacterized membrane protein
MNEILSFFDPGGGAWVLAKILAIIGLFVYVVFALTIVKQVNHMTDTLEVGFEKQLRAISVLHLIFALGTVLVALFVL